MSDLAKKKAEGSVDRRNRFAKLCKTLLFARFHFRLARKHCTKSYFAVREIAYDDVERLAHLRLLGRIERKLLEHGEVLLGPKGLQKMRGCMCFVAMNGKTIRRLGPESPLFSFRNGGEFSDQSRREGGFGEGRGLQLACSLLLLGLLVVNGPFELFLLLSEFDAFDSKLFDCFSIFQKQRFHRLAFFFQFFTLAFPLFHRIFFLVSCE